MEQRLIILRPFFANEVSARRRITQAKLCHFSDNDRTSETINIYEDLLEIDLDKPMIIDSLGNLL